MARITDIQATIREKYANKLHERLDAASNLREKYQAIVDVPFYDAYESTKLDLGIVVLLLVNRRAKTIDRVALSDTEPAKGAVSISTLPFAKIKIPLKHETNALAQVIETKKPQTVADWKFLFVPAMDEISARHNQSGAGIGCSLVYPLISGRARLGAMIFSLYQPPTSLRERHHKFAETYSSIVSDELPAIKRR